MKYFIVMSFVAFAVAIPVDNKSPPLPKSNPVFDNKQAAIDPIPLNKAPLSPSTVDLHPLSKRDTSDKQTPKDSKKSQPAAPAPVAQKVDSTKTVDNKRKTRDTVQKNTPTVLTPQTTNAQPSKSVDPVKTQKVDSLSQNTRKTRETAKTDEAKKTPSGNVQKPSSASAPQVARVPLTSTNSRSRRDTVKSVDQSKTVPAVATNVKSETNLDKTKSSAPSASVTESKSKRDTPISSSQAQPSDNQGTVGLKRPVPVDQIIKRKGANTEAPTAIAA